jgi:hypothetical protein
MDRDAWEFLALSSSVDAGMGASVAPESVAYYLFVETTMEPNQAVETARISVTSVGTSCADGPRI